MAYRLAAALVLAATTATLAGCVIDGRDLNNSGNDSGFSDASYRCKDDRRFSVDFRDNGDRARVDAGSSSYDLRLQNSSRRSASYAGKDGDVRLNLDRDAADLRIKGEKDYTDCERR